MLTKGTLIKCKTKTLQDVFGEVVYEITEVGLPAPEPERKGVNDGVIATMLGGSGPSARKGFTVLDSEFNVQNEIQKGVVEVIPPEKRQAIINYYEALNNVKSGSAGGIIEL
jgi:hypothetical protein